MHQKSQPQALRAAQAAIRNGSTVLIDGACVVIWAVPHECDHSCISCQYVARTVETYVYRPSQYRRLRDQWIGGLDG